MLFLALVAVGQTGAFYDAKEHRLEAPGAAAADLRAPSAAIARVKAERAARKQAEERLKAALEELGAPTKAGGAGGALSVAKKDLDATVGKASVVDEQYGSDGSVVLRLQLSTEGLELHRK